MRNAIADFFIRRFKVVRKSPANIIIPSEDTLANSERVLFRYFGDR